MKNLRGKLLSLDRTLPIGEVQTKVRQHNEIVYNITNRFIIKLPFLSIPLFSLSGISSWVVYPSSSPISTSFFQTDNFYHQFIINFFNSSILVHG